MKYISFVLLLAIMMCIPLKMAISANVEIALEAELANKIQAPMAIGIPKDAKDKGGPEPDDPSDGKFIWMPGAPLGETGGNGFAQYIINLSKKGKYAVWGRVVAWDGNSDSFWVTWEPADPAENPQQTQNQNFRWAVDQGPAWHWVRINQWLDAGTINREWELDKGETKLTIWVREDGTMLDCLFITDILSTDPAAAGVRLPDDSDRDTQTKLKSQVVKSLGKLSVTWGCVKSQYQ